MRATKRCVNARARLLNLTVELAGHPQYRAIQEVVWRLLSLACSRSECGDEDGARDIESRVKRSLKKLHSARALDETQVRRLIAGEEASLTQTRTEPCA